ncbi:MAG: type II secretion system protein GspN [Nitrospinota bacterium]|nr:MAG: type II secretion system protein GspN [Nitrospinota bacterium]
MISERGKHLVLSCLGYFLYGILLFAFFVYLNFPYEQVRHHLLNSLGRRGGDLQVDISQISPALPLSFAFRDLQVARRDADQPVPLLQIQEMRTRPQLLPLLHGKAGVRFHAVLYGGEISGEAELSLWGNGARRLSVQAQLQELNLQRYTPLSLLYKITPRGTLAGEISLSAPLQRWIEGEGEAVLTIKGGSLEGITVFHIPLPPLEYDELYSELSLAQKRLRINKLRLQGRQINAGIDGKILLNDPLETSTLDLTVRLRIAGALEQQFAPLRALLKGRRDRRGFLSFHIRGSLQRPRLSL